MNNRRPDGTPENSILRVLASNQGLTTVKDLRVETGWASGTIQDHLNRMLGTRYSEANVARDHSEKPYRWCLAPHGLYVAEKRGLTRRKNLSATEDRMARR